MLTPSAEEVNLMAQYKSHFNYVFYALEVIAEWIFIFVFTFFHREN